MNEGSNKVNIWTRLTNAVCIIVMSVCVVFIVLPGTAVRSLFGGSGSVSSTASSAKREALQPGSVNETAYFTKDTFLNDPIVIEKGLKHFYKLTGVQPYVQIETSVDNLYISQDLDIPRDLVAYTRALYPQLFTDESHLLLVYYYDFDNDYTRYKLNYCIVSGSKAKTVIDSEAEKILSDNIEYCFQDSGISEEMFSNAFSGAADRIMGVAPPPYDIAVFIIPGAAALLIVLLILLRKKNRRKKLREQQDKEILTRPLKHYGSDIGAKSRQAAQNNTVTGGPGCDTLSKDEAEVLAEKYAEKRYSRNKMR